MWEQLRKRLLTWLTDPLPPIPEVQWHDLQAVQDRMDSLERMMMTQLQRPDEGPASSEATLSMIPDAHLGAQ